MSCSPARGPPWPSCSSPCAAATSSPARRLTVDDVAATLDRVEARFADGKVGHLDGISVDYPSWHFNVRPSNTEPLVRLNLGADSEAEMEEKRDLVLGVIRGG